MELEKLEMAEQKRTYYYPNGETVVINNVTHFKASDTTHRLQTADGKLHIVPRTGWLHIEIEAQGFSV